MTSMARYIVTALEGRQAGTVMPFVIVHKVTGAIVGSRVQWQSSTQVDSNSRVQQSAYALVDLMASYDFDDHWSTALNLNNVTDQKYLLSLYQAAGSTNYGAPRNVTASVSWKY